jgi:hypothetical protein
MRTPVDASIGPVLKDVRLEEVTGPRDPRLGDLAQLLLRTFADPDSVLGLDRIQEFLSEGRSNSRRDFHVLLAESSNAAAVVGASIFSYVVSSNCGFSEYLVVDAALRQRGLGRGLFDRRKMTLDAVALRHGQDACHGLFIEVDSPSRTPPELLSAESLDATERLRIFQHLGFHRVAVPYVQPPLAPDKKPVDYMDLLFAPWSTETPADSIPAEWIFDTLAAIWSAWTPASFGAYLADLRRRVTTSRVALVDPLSAK